MNLERANFPIAIKLPDGNIIYSTHACNLDIPWLPHAVTEGQIVPGLAHSSLISTRNIFDAGCRVAFDEEECRVYYKGELVLAGGRDEQSGMWKLPIKPINKSNDNAYLDLAPTNKGTGHTASNLYTLPYKQRQLKYMHQAFFNPLIAKIIDVANNNQLHVIPFLGKPELM